MRCFSVDTGIRQAQVTHGGVTVELAEQTGLQIADGVTATVIVALEDHAWLRVIVAEIAGLAIAGIRRKALVSANAGQGCTVGNVDGLLW